MNRSCSAKKGANKKRGKVNLAPGVENMKKKSEGIVKKP